MWADNVLLHHLHLGLVRRRDRDEESGEIVPVPKSSKAGTTPLSLDLIEDWQGLLIT